MSNRDILLLCRTNGCETLAPMMSLATIETLKSTLVNINISSRDIGELVENNLIAVWEETMHKYASITYHPDGKMNFLNSPRDFDTKAVLTEIIKYVSHRLELAVNEKRFERCYLKGSQSIIHNASSKWINKYLTLTSIKQVHIGVVVND